MGWGRLRYGGVYGVCVCVGGGIKGNNAQKFALLSLQPTASRVVACRQDVCERPSDKEKLRLAKAK